MSRPFGIPAWKSLPFFRLLWPFIAGIVWQWYQPAQLAVMLIAVAGCMTISLLLGILSISVRYQLRRIQGIFLHFILFALGMLVTRMADPTADENWYGSRYQKEDMLLVSLLEPLTEKASTYKAEVRVDGLIRDGRMIPAKGKTLLYFFKESISTKLDYGDRLLINKPLQPITNSGNPGAFNYRQYAAFHHLFHRAYLKASDWRQVRGKSRNGFNRFIIAAREKILAVLRKHLGDSKDALGIAEALLIGYTNDLDKDLVQAYSNTGVVHVIAISGMHLALIYLLLTGVFKHMPVIKRLPVLQMVLVLIFLWTFSFITGASASVLRAAVMFSFMAVGKQYFKTASVFNSLAASAFVLLVYNPYFLWDVGFQLSYLAVIGILLFQQPLYRIFFFKKPWISRIWQLASVTLAAQVLTFPVCIYYFHQFPVLFLFANLVIVPLSSLVLYAELGLLSLSFIPFLNEWLAALVSLLIRLMNGTIRLVNELPFAVWDDIPSGLLSTCLLYAVVGLFSFSLLNRSKPLLFYGLFCLLGFTLELTYANWQVFRQQKIVVYQVSKHQAIDIISGNHYYFIGDSALLRDGITKNFHLKPARVAYRLAGSINEFPGKRMDEFFYQFGNTRFALIGRSVSFLPTVKKTRLDFILLSNNSGIRISNLAAAFDCPLIVFDASNRLWKIEQWMKECDALHLQGYSIPERGAFISSQ